MPINAHVSSTCSIDMLGLVLEGETAAAVMIR